MANLQARNACGYQTAHTRGVGPFGTVCSALGTRIHRLRDTPEINRDAGHVRLKSVHDPEYATPAVFRCAVLGCAIVSRVALSVDRKRPLANQAHVDVLVLLETSFLPRRIRWCWN